MVQFGGAVCIPERPLMNSAWIRLIAHIEDLKLKPLIHARGLIDISSNGEEMIFGERVHIRAETRDLEFAKDFRLRRIAKIDRKKRIDLPEGDDIAVIAHEADSEDRLVGGERRRLAHADELAAFGPKRDELVRRRSPPPALSVGALITIADGGADDALVDIERELVAEPALEKARCLVCGVSLVQKKAMEHAPFLDRARRRIVMRAVA